MAAEDGELVVVGSGAGSGGGGVDVDADAAALADAESAGGAGPALDIAAALAAATAAGVGGECVSQFHSWGVNQDCLGHCWKSGSRSAPVEGRSTAGSGNGFVPAAILDATYDHPDAHLTQTVPYGLKKLSDGHVVSAV